MRRPADAAAAAAALALVVGMGIGRFAFTGLYPAMVREGHLSVSGGSYAASANYAGYLAGALLAGALAGVSSLRVCFASLVATVITTGALALPFGEAFVIALRGLGGVASALAMVAASHWLIHDRQHPEGAPALFSGVGVGIMLSAELIAGARSLGLHSGRVWLLLAVVSVVLAGLSSFLAVRLPKPASAAASAAETSGGELLPAGRLILIYGLAGFGYIVTATYLPLLVRSALGSIDPVHVWAVFGLGAIPSCFFWHAWHIRWGTRLSLVANLAVQALGVALPALSHSAPAYLASALLVGGTFTGTVTIAMPAARRVGHTVRFNMLAIMTAAYGVGQIVGPLAASALFARFRSFDPSLLLAAAALVLACLCAAMRPSPASAPVLVDQRN